MTFMTEIFYNPFVSLKTLNTVFRPFSFFVAMKRSTLFFLIRCLQLHFGVLNFLWHFRSYWYLLLSLQSWSWLQSDEHFSYDAGRYLLSTALERLVDINVFFRTRLPCSKQTSMVSFLHSIYGQTKKWSFVRSQNEEQDHLWLSFTQASLLTFVGNNKAEIIWIKVFSRQM